MLRHGGNSSPSQQRLLTSIPRSDVTDDGKGRHFGSEDADYKVAGSDIGSRKQSVEDREGKEREKLNYTDKGRPNERYVENSRLSENSVRRKSIDNSLMTRGRLTESQVDINTESTDHDLLEKEAFRRSDKIQCGEEKYRTDTQNNCETCQGLLNDDKHNRIICTAL